MNYFELFGLENKFSLDTKQLVEKYQTLQKSVHPDKFASASSQEQMLAVKKSSMLNDAYQTLKQPLRRAQYMLEQRGTDMPSEQSSFKDTSFLMRQMELREMLAEVKFANDVEDAVHQATETLEQEFEQHFKAMQVKLLENTAESDIQASELLRKLKFYQKLHIELDKLEDLLFED